MSSKANQTPEDNLIDSLDFITNHFCERFNKNLLSETDILTVLIMMLGRTISCKVLPENWPKIYKAIEQYADQCLGQDKFKPISIN